MATWMHKDGESELVEIEFVHSYRESGWSYEKDAPKKRGRPPKKPIESEEENE